MKTNNPHVFDVVLHTLASIVSLKYETFYGGKAVIARP